MTWTRADLAARIDHAVLSPRAGRGDVVEAAMRCAEAAVRALCVAPRHAPTASRALAGGSVRLVVVAGFPSAASCASITVQEARRAVLEGADEIDLVLPWGAILEDRLAEVRDEVAAVVEAVAGRPVKGIVEASELPDATILRVCADVLKPAGAHWLKTGTGIHGRPLPADRIRGLRDAMPPALGLKVSGGIADRTAAIDALDAGAGLVGCSRTFEILQES